jgi:uncharacterized protein (TIGR00255 family)
MALQSMTGFATKNFFLMTPQGGKANVSLSLKSLNSRFFEVTSKLPLSLLPLETKFISLFKSTLTRGHIYFVIYLSSIDIFQGGIEPSLITLEAYVSAIERIKKHFSITTPLSLEHLLRLPNIFSIEEGSLDTTSEEHIFKETEALIQAVVEARIAEGTILCNDFMKLIRTMHQEMAQIEARTNIVFDAKKHKLQELFQEFGTDSTLVADAQKNSLYAILDKMDIHEEIVRFKSHLNNFEAHLTSPDGEKGKQLDFILQELGRETNTIAAKCSDAVIGTHAINLKVAIEKAREQVQNIV